MFYSDRLLRKKLILFLGDVVILFASLYGALSIRVMQLVPLEIFWQHLQIFVPIIVSILVVYFLFDLYNLRVLKNLYRLLYLLLGAVLTSTLVATSILYVVGFFSTLAPKTILAIFTLLVMSLTAVWRFLFYDFFFSGVKYIKRVVLVGSETIRENITRLNRGIEGVDYSIVGYVSTQAGRTDSPFADIPFLGDWERLQQIIQEHRVDEIILAFDYRSRPDIVKELSDSLSLGVRIFDWPIFYEAVFQKIPTNHIDHFWFISNIDEQNKRLFERFKRVMDVLVALPGVLALLVICPFVALGTKLTAPGPIFFTQQRIGRGGKLFTLYKFRSMKVDAEKNGAIWATQKDNRATAFGRFLRQTRIDELPQLYNILKGDMSLVGPRPERPEFMPILSEKIPFYYKRHQVRPGITGFAQIMFPYAASVEDSLEKVGYDLYYIKNRSLFLYFKIMLRTIKVVLTMQGR